MPQTPDFIPLNAAPDFIPVDNKSPIPVAGGQVQGDAPSDPFAQRQNELMTAAPEKVTPQEGESFADTMKRAVEMGKNVTDEQVQNSAATGVVEAPKVLAAAPAIGAAGAAGIAGASLAPAAVAATGSFAAAHMAEIDKIVKIAKNLGWSAFGIKEGIDLYQKLRSLTK